MLETFGHPMPIGVLFLLLNPLAIPLFDEFVQVLNGTSVLTAADGEPQEFTVGDNFVVPKGFTGTWEMRGNFRELIIMEANALAAGMEKFGFA